MRGSRRVVGGEIKRDLAFTLLREEPIVNVSENIPHSEVIYNVHTHTHRYATFGSPLINIKGSENAQVSPRLCLRYFNSKQIIVFETVTDKKCLRSFHIILYAFDLTTIVQYICWNIIM